MKISNEDIENKIDNEMDNETDGVGNSTKQEKTSRTSIKVHPSWIILGMVTLIVFGGFNVYNDINDVNAIKKTQIAEIKDLENDIARLKSLVPEDDQPDTNVVGVSRSRTSTDSSIAEGLFKTVLTWDNYSGYLEKRDMLISDYSVGEDDSLLVSFMPIMSESTFGASNMSYSSLTQYVTGMSDGGVYSYFTIVTVQASNADGTQASGNVAFSYDINSDGIMTNIEAYTL